MNSSKAKITFFCFLLFLLAAAFQMPETQQNPASFTSGEWQYIIVGDTVQITGYTGFSRVVEIPAELDHYPVTVIGEDVFRDRTEIQRVRFPDSVETIGPAAFLGCTSLEEVIFGSGLTQIQMEAFRYCESLKEISFPLSLMTIGTAAFEGCTGLQTLLLPDSVIAVSSSAFQYCSNLSDITFSRNLRTLGENAFDSTPWLEAQTDEFVFVGNWILLKYNGNDPVVTVPIQTTAIVDAFMNHITLEEVILPRTLTEIGGNAFNGCLNLKSIDIPETVISIGNYAFQGCRTLKEVVLPKSLKTIGINAFHECTSLETIELPAGVKNIHSRQFAFCPALTRFAIPATVDSIHDIAFENSNNITFEVVYGTLGEEYAKEKMIPYTYLIEKNADFTFRRSEEGIEIISYLGQLYEVRVPDFIEDLPVWKIGPGAFQQSAYVRSVVIPESIREIGDWAFSNIPTLTSVRIADGAKKIGANAFTGSHNLWDLVIPASVDEIGLKAFDGCPNLTIQTTPGTVAWTQAEQAEIPHTDPFAAIPDFQIETQDGEYVLTGYIGAGYDVTLVSDVVGLKVTKVGAAAFESGAVQVVRIPEGYTTIESQAFASMLYPMTIVLPESITEIAEDAFENTDVTFMAKTGTAAEAYAREHELKFQVLYW